MVFRGPAGYHKARRFATNSTTMERMMIDDVSDIADYYNSDPALEHSRLERHQLEFELTWRFLTEYLPEKGDILEVGAASGAYTQALARRGYRITAVDLSANLLELNRQALAAEGLLENVHLVEADARDLGQVKQRAFDAVLLMGPLYHLTAEADRLAALGEVFDRLKQGGLIFSALISRFGILGDLMKKIPEWIEDQAKVQSLLAAGKRPDGRPPGGFRAYFATVPEIEPLHEAAGFETVALVAVEPGISADDESYNRLQGEQRRLWLELLYQVSAEPSIMAASRHLLYIGRKGPGAGG
jgi:S-adenosylmethionine-dependent methyltransferase